MSITTAVCMSSKEFNTCIESSAGNLQERISLVDKGKDQIKVCTIENISK